MSIPQTDNALNLHFGGLGKKVRGILANHASNQVTGHVAEVTGREEDILTRFETLLLKSPRAGNVPKDPGDTIREECRRQTARSCMARLILATLRRQMVERDSEAIQREGMRDDTHCWVVEGDGDNSEA